MGAATKEIGDVFTVKIDANSKKYFQLTAFDLMQLNSDVIRSFSRPYLADACPDLHEVVNGEVQFYAHCITKLGLKMGYWEKAGHVVDIGKMDHILFRNTSDYGSRPGEQIKVSEKWYVWRIDDRSFTKVGKLEGENRNAEVGIVISPDSIVYRMKEGQYDFVYPEFE